MSPDLVVVKYGEVRLPRKMIGGLPAEDWRPLLAPSILYNYDLSRDKNRGSLMRLVLPVGLGEIPLVPALLEILRPANRDSWGLSYLRKLASGSSIPSPFVDHTSSGSGKASPTPQTSVANTIGKEVLLEALAKYRGTISTVGPAPKRPHSWPALNQRIERLQKTDKANRSWYAVYGMLIYPRRDMTFLGP